MTVQELINALQEIQNKELQVYHYNDIDDTRIDLVEVGTGIMGEKYGVHLSDSISL